MKKIIFPFVFITMASFAVAQKGRTVRFTSSNSMFPDTARSKGHLYNNKLYDAYTNYSDSSVLVYIPDDFSPEKKINLVFWFHGWGNNIDSACKQYRLLEQFDASGRNAVFVFPEGPKNAPDSYGGKLEQPQVFQALVKEVADKLAAGKIIKQRQFRLDDYTISLAGHSGAYRVISRIINKTPVDEVILFDAMYGGNDAYLQWLTDPAHRFINIYTKDGGTYDNSRMIAGLVSDSLHIPIVSLTEEEVSASVLNANNKIFMFSSKAHNEVITNNNNWERFLRSRPDKK